MSYQVSLALAESAALCNTTTFEFPKLRSFYSLGDSYSAGIGATCTPWIKDTFDPNGDCLKCEGAYPYQILSIANSSSSSSPPCPDPSTNASVYHLGCTGASMNDVLSTGWNNRTSQLELMAEEAGDGGWGTISIGGNDVGFANIVADCIMINTASCDASMNITESLLADPLLLEQLTATYLAVLSTAASPDFTLIVPGYARFFNAETSLCDTKYFIRGRYLTGEFRRRLNQMIADLNLVIQIAVAVVQMQLVFSNSRKSIFYEDWDVLFEGHRFCEEAPLDWNRDSWFFTILGDDILPDPDGTFAPPERVQAPGNEMPYDLTTMGEICEDMQGKDRAERVVCNWAMSLEEERRLGDLERLEEETTLVYPWYVKKAMHPKSIAHYALGKKIHESWTSGDYF